MFHIKLSDLVVLKYGKNQRQVEDKDGKYPIIGTGGVIGFADSYLFPGPSILFGRKGTIGDVFYQKSPFWAIDTVFYTIINYKVVMPQYLYYKLSTIDFKKYDEGTTIPSLRTETLNKIEIDIHNLQEQQHIVGIIGSVDDLIEKNEGIIRRIIAFSKMEFDSIYESSNTERLGKRIKFVKGKQPSISEGGASKGYLTIEALATGNSDVVSTEGVLCKENDVLMVMDGASSGRCFIGNDGYVGSTLAKIDPNGINPAILFFALERHEKEIAEHTTGSAIPHADKSFVSELFYPIVDTETAFSFERMISLVVSKRKENLKLKALKTAFLAKFF